MEEYVRGIVDGFKRVIGEDEYTADFTHKRINNGINE